MNRQVDYTFKHNALLGRHGWLRLTPAYSVKVVRQILDNHPEINNVLDPFSGTGTTGLVCAERGLNCDLLDINPFLVWFGRVKTTNYRQESLSSTLAVVNKIVKAGNSVRADDLWFPPISGIERWWSVSSRDLLARIRHLILRFTNEGSPERDLLYVAFCRCVIEWSNAAFNHQSMSFKEEQDSLFEHDSDTRLIEFRVAVERIVETAGNLLTGSACIRLADSRNVPPPSVMKYDGLITSPPYPNRMSYVRELRPYMYWLGYLNEAREAGELDWKAIGGTWGIATSWVAKWVPNGTVVPHEGFDQMVNSITALSPTLANYVHKYFVDTVSHVNSISRHLNDGARVFYIVGNSKFYETMVHVEEIYASILRYAGFRQVKIETLRKRNSKKELFEYVVSAIK